MPGKKDKASAIEEGDGCIDVLFILHEKFDLMDLAGPLKALDQALHDEENKDSKAFEITLVGEGSYVMSMQGIQVAPQIDYKEAHERLNDFDVVVVLGGNVNEITGRNPEKEESLKLIKAYAKLQEDDNTRERTLFSVGSGSLILAKLYLLCGLSATTDTNYETTFEILCSDPVRIHGLERTTVEDGVRYVVNNLRFALEEEGDEGPYVRRGSDSGSRPLTARKGSISFKNSGRRESIERRSHMPLSGLRVITSGGGGAGIDAALYLVAALVSHESALAVERKMAWTWTKGHVVDGVDV